MRSSGKETGTNGLLLNISVTSAINVTRTSWVSWRLGCFNSMASRMRRARPITLSHTPPMWDEWGALKIQLQPFLFRNLLKVGSSMFTALIPNASVHPTKFVPLSDLNSTTLPRMEMKRRRALMKAEEDISSTTSIWEALEERQVKNIAQRLLLELPPHVFLVTTSQWPNISTPT